MEVHTSEPSATPASSDCVSLRFGPSSSNAANGKSKAPLSPSSMRPCFIQRQNCKPCPQSRPPGGRMPSAMEQDSQSDSAKAQASDQQLGGPGWDQVNPSEQWINALQSISNADTQQLWSAGISGNGGCPSQQPDNITPRNSSNLGYHRSKRQCVPPRGPSNACTSELQSQAIDNRQRNSPDSLVHRSGSPSRPDSQNGRHDTCAPQVRKSSSLGLRLSAHSTPIEEPQPGHINSAANQSESPTNDQVQGPKTPPTEVNLDSAQTPSNRHNHPPIASSHHQSIARDCQGAANSHESAVADAEVEPDLRRFSKRHSISGPADVAVQKGNDGRRSSVGGAMMRNARPHDYRPAAPLNSFQQPNIPRGLERVELRRRREDDHFDMGLRRKREDDDRFDVGLRRKREDHDNFDVGLHRRREENDHFDVGLRRKREEDDHLDDVDNFHDLDDYGGLDGAVNREEAAYVNLLPRVRQQMRDLRVTNAWPFDREEKNCIVCGYPVRLKGWKGLLQHAENFKKSRITEHRAYFRILSEQLKPRHAKLDNANSHGKAANVPQGKIPEKVPEVPEVPEKVPEETMVWPPVVIIDNVNEKESLDRYLTDIKPSDVQRVFRFRDKEHPDLGRLLLVFPPSDVGHSNSRRLVDNLDKLFASPGVRDDDESHNSQLRSKAQNDSSQGGWLTQANGGNTDIQVTRDQDKMSTCSPTTSQMHPPRAFIAESADMEEMDPEGKHFQWKIEKKRETPERIVEESKEEPELVKSPVQNDNLPETERLVDLQKQFKSRKALLSQKLKDLDVARQGQKERRVQIARQRSLQLREIDEKFEDELRVLETERMETEVEFRRLLEENEIEAEKERDARNKEMLALATQLEKYKQQLRTQKSQRSGERDQANEQRIAEQDVMIRMNEEQFKEYLRGLTQRITEEHTLEKARLLEVHDMTQQEILRSWEVTEATLKRKIEIARQDNERLLKEAETKQATLKGPAAECSVCLSEFKGGNERALIRPCGHAKTCHPCAFDIFNTSKLCPICRVEMSKRPIALPLKLYL